LLGPAIIGRWEWRAFGAGAKAAQRHFDNLTPDGVEESEASGGVGCGDRHLMLRPGDLEVGPTGRSARGDARQSCRH